MENLLFLGVPILKHIRVDFSTACCLVKPVSVNVCKAYFAGINSNAKDYFIN